LFHGVFIMFDNQNSDDDGETFSIADFLPDASEGPEAAYMRKVILTTLEEALVLAP